MTRHFRTLLVGAAALAAFIGLAPWSQAQALTAADCANLMTAAVPNTTITGAVLVPAGGGLPEYCKVTGHVDTEIDFELRLPTSWNGKFYHEGGGGFVGSINPPGNGIRRGYAEVTTDTGHVGMGIAALDGTWALNRPDRQVNFGHRAIHVVTVAGKQITERYYGRPPRLAYFEGCSNGGRQAAMEAQRYPTDFNGIISGAPALDWTGLMTGFNWDEQALQGAAAIPPSKLTVIANEVVSQCDAKDGLVDGLVDNPRRCGFDPSVLTCPAGDAPSCLTAAQVEAVEKIYGGPVNSEGEQLHPGFPPGAEDGGDGWQLWISGPAVLGNILAPPLQFTFEDQYMRYFVFGPSFNSLTFNFDTDPPKLAPTGEFLNAINPDLSAFKAAGGKLIMWHGWADHALTTDRTVQYYHDVIRTMGTRNRTEDFYRLFLAPGMHHCGGGPGPNTLDALTALENWVEGGIAPDQVIATHSTAGKVDRSRPLCPYPKIAVYNGSGSIDGAANFSCKERGLGYAEKGFQTGQ